MLSPFSRILAPALVTSHTSQINTPGWAPKNNSAPFEIAVLPTDRLSISLLTRILEELFVDPTPPVMASPNPSPHESTRNRSPRDDNPPKVPKAYPGWPRLRALIVFKILTARDHLQSQKGTKGV